jgi:hypothetical protein
MLRQYARHFITGDFPQCVWEPWDSYSSTSGDCRGYIVGIVPQSRIVRVSRLADQVSVVTKSSVRAEVASCRLATAKSS